ncbi:hypothetical protein KEM60_02108 [Austwickia sp. TVS 96-490-7B]|nr:hypothetical protein [Austwickia sp. TVS 96-490-7B]
MGEGAGRDQGQPYGDGEAIGDDPAPKGAWMAHPGGRCDPQRRLAGFRSIEWRDAIGGMCNDAVRERDVVRSGESQRPVTFMSCFVDSRDKVLGFVDEADGRLG